MANWQFASYSIILVLTASIAALISHFAWKRSSTRGSKTLALLMLAVAEWSLTDLFGAAAIEESTKIFWSQVSYLGIHSIPPLYLILALQYSQRESWLTRRNKILLCVMPVIAIGLAATNHWHNLIWSGFSWAASDPTVLIYHYGPGFWVSVAYDYSLILITTWNLIYAAFHLKNLYRRQIVFVVLAALLPWVGNFLYITKLNPLPGRDLTPIMFLLTGTFLSWNMFRHQFLKLTPIARSKLVDTITDAVIVIDSQLRIGDLNPAAQFILGGDANSIIGKPAHQVLSNWPHLESHFIERKDTPTEAKIIPDKRGHWYETRILPLKGWREQPQGWLLILRDITAQRELEKALRASEELYRNVTESANDGIAIFQDNIIEYCNPQLAVMIGYQLNEIEGKPFINFIAPDQIEFIRERHERRMRGEKVPNRYKSAVAHSSGQRVPVEFNVSTMMYRGKPAALAIVRDISERLQAEQEISKLAAVVEQTRETIVITDLDGSIVYANPQFEVITGYSLEEAIGKNPRILNSGYQSKTFYQNLWDTLTSGNVWEGIFVNKRQDDSLYHEAASIFPIKDQNGKTTHYAAVKRDITDQVQADEELHEYARQQKLLNDLTRAAIETTELDTTLQILADRFGELIHADGCYITLWNPETQETIPAAAYGPLRESYRKIKPDPDEPTITQAVLRDEKPLVIEDVDNTPHLDPERAAQFPARSMLAIPLIIDDQKLGAALIAFNEHHTFTSEEFKLGEQASRQIGLAVFKARLLDTAHQHATESETLRQASAAVAATLKLDETIDRILEQLNRVVPYDSASVQLLHENKFEIVGQRGFEDPSSVLGMSFSLADDAPNRIVIERRKPYIVKDAPAAYEVFRNSPHDHIRSWMGAPLIIQDRIIGMLALHSVQFNCFTTEHTRLASVFAAQVAIALENARLYEETHRLSIIDSMTGIFNRRHFMDLAQQEYQRSRRYNRPLSIIMLDLDHFKAVNDDYGHLTGDQILQTIVSLCQDNLRESDIIGRYGGEEFIVLLPETQGQAPPTNKPEPNHDQLQSTAKDVAERLRQIVEKTSIHTAKGDVRITISLGVAELSESNESIDTLIDHADQALYAAKENGRNQVAVYS